MLSNSALQIMKVYLNNLAKKCLILIEQNTKPKQNCWHVNSLFIITRRSCKMHLSYLKKEHYGFSSIA